METTAKPARLVVALLVLTGLLVACGSGDESSDTTTTDSTTTTTAATTSTTEGTTSTTESTTTTTESTTSTEATTSTSVLTLEQPAIWPAADVVFTTPTAAAEDFVTTALGVPADLGEFMQGDSRSGEIEVYFPGEGANATRVLRGLLLLRQLGPDSGWFVLAAVNTNAAITAPDSMAEVPAGPLTVEGVGRGFEATVIVEAFVAGRDTLLDQVVTSGGSFETPEPFTVTVDLSGAQPGDVVGLLVRGGVGLETDPGDFGAIPVVIAG